jgi:hypothetical protein
VRRRYFLPVFASYPDQRLLRAVVSMAEVLAGLFLVVMHNRWSPLPAAVITVVGWLVLLEGLLYLALPDDRVRRFIATFNTEGWRAVCWRQRLEPILQPSASAGSSLLQFSGTHCGW